MRNRDLYVLGIIVNSVKSTDVKTFHFPLSEISDEITARIITYFGVLSLNHACCERSAEKSEKA